jgi:serine/threonine protein kinase
LTGNDLKDSMQQRTMVKLIDLGDASSADGAVPKEPFGTVFYRAPETFGMNIET